MKAVAVLVGLVLLITYASAQPVPSPSMLRKQILSQLYNTAKAHKEELEERAKELMEMDSGLKGGKGETVISFVGNS